MSYNRVRQSTATTGTGTITLGAADAGFQTAAAAAVPNGTLLQYVIEDGLAWEVGSGTYSTAGPTLTRSLESSSTGSLLNLSGTAKVSITVAASSIRKLTELSTATILGRTSAGTGPAEGLSIAQIKALLAYTATDINFTAPGTGGIARTTASILDNLLYPESYGCACDGTTDDTVNFQKAVDAAATQKKTLHMPATIKFGAINIPAGTHIMGPGNKSTIVATAGSYDMFTINGSDVTIENLMINGAAMTGGYGFNINCGTSTIERLILQNINSTHLKGGCKDTGTSGIHITTRLNRIQFRLHKGPGISWTQAFAYGFLNEVTIDYVGSGLNGNFLGFSFDCDTARLGPAAGGIFLRDCDVLGTIAEAGNTTGSTNNIPNQSCFNFTNAAAVGIYNCRADSSGGYGYNFNNINKLVLIDASASLNAGHAFIFTTVYNSYVAGIGAYGRKDQTFAPASIDGLRFVSGCYTFSFVGGTIRDFTGNGINKAAAQSGTVQLVGLTVSNNGDKGVTTTGTSSFIFASGILSGNIGGDYTLGGGFDFILGTELNSGSVVNANSTTSVSVFATASAGAGGSDRTIQFNAGGSLGGAPDVSLDTAGNLRIGDTGSTTTPIANAFTISPQRIATGGGAVMFRIGNEDTTKTTLATHPGRNTIFMAQAVGNATTALQLFGGTALTAVGTATARTVATTSRATRAKRLGYVSAATAGAVAGVHNGSFSQQYTIGTGTVLSGGGFRAVFRWTVSDAATVSGAHMFIGMTSNTAAPAAATSPATFTNSVGVAQVNGSANLQLVYGGSAAQTAIDLGANFPAAGNTTNLYELILYARPDQANSVAYRVENISTGNSTSGVLTGTAGTALPSGTTLLGPRMFRSNNATALAVGLDILSWYIESDI